jgi:hypothetical protein
MRLADGMVPHQTYRVGLLLEHPGTPRDAEAIEQLRAALPDAGVTDPDRYGVFEAEVAAPSFEAALERVWDAVAAAGVDDHVRFAEHPDIPEHWRHRTAAQPG